MDLKSPNYSEAVKKFANWIESSEKRLNSACHCCPETKIQAINGTNTTTNTINPIKTSHDRAQKWKRVIDSHRKLQDEVEDIGKQLNCELKRHLNGDKTSSKEQWDKYDDLVRRWHKLWLNSLEQLVIVERIKRCPTHNSTIIGKPSSPSNKSLAKPRRRRPISYPNDQNETFEWDDYKNYKDDKELSLTGFHKEIGSQIDLDSVDEQITKNLIASAENYGENYELWIPLENEIDCIHMHSRPPSVEPAEKPEIAKATVISDQNHHQNVNSNLLRLTAPSSMISVDASNYSSRKKKSLLLRVIICILFSLVAGLVSFYFQEPHLMHKSYYHKQPPV